MKPERTAKQYKNLIPNSERTPEELREMGSKGGIRSGEVRRKNKELRWKMKILWDALVAMEPEQLETFLDTANALAHESSKNFMN